MICKKFPPNNLKPFDDPVRFILIEGKKFGEDSVLANEYVVSIQAKEVVLCLKKAMG